MISSDYRMYISAAVSSPKSRQNEVPNNVVLEELKENYGFSRGKVYNKQENVFAYRKDNQILLVKEENKLGIVMQNYFTIN
jgi:hypothetical protein